jgi:hypothetical protein
MVLPVGETGDIDGALNWSFQNSSFKILNRSNPVPQRQRCVHLPLRLIPEKLIGFPNGKHKLTHAAYFL